MSDAIVVRATTRLQKIALWFDSAAAGPRLAGQGQLVDWLRVVPFVGMHLACLGVIGVGNHHRFPGSARQGFYWWEFDLTYFALWLLARVRVIRDLRPVPRRVLEAGA